MRTYLAGVDRIEAPGAPPSRTPAEVRSAA